MQPAILVNTDTNNSIAPAVVSSSEVNIELIDKLFRSFKQKASQNYDSVSAKYNEMEKLRNNTSGENQPFILTKSREIAKNNKPIYSDERYESEIQKYRTIRNIEPPALDKSKSISYGANAPQISHFNTSTSVSPMGRNTGRFLKTNTVLHEQALKIDSVMQQHNLQFNADAGGKRLNMDEFAKKYETQRIKWERLKNSPPVDHRLEEEEREMEEATFKPAINNKSKNLVRDLDKIQNRVN